MTTKLKPGNKGFAPSALLPPSGRQLSAPAISPSPFWEVALGRAPNPHLHFHKNKVFVIMAFSPDMSEVYEAIKDECLSHEFLSQRVDEVSGSGLVISEIVDLIKQAEFIICDLTHERPNVYYELGYAHGVGNHGSNILLIAREGTKLHFDVAPLQVAFYESIDQLRSKLGSFALAVIRKRAGQPPSNFES